jgi:hypothetical protein
VQRKARNRSRLKRANVSQKTELASQFIQTTRETGSGPHALARATANPAVQRCFGAACDILSGSAARGFGSTRPDSERFRSIPKTCRPLCGRLSVR